jgi:CheY-like chemotaxis protein
MGKILLVEDDNSLREIFEMRLQAEGFTTVTAGNGEEGLAVALREKPDLIIADVMMPKLSGFDMLAQIRSAPELKNTKAIMMTALGQAEDQARGNALGVVKYLVKSQATLEDFTRVVKEVMGQMSPTNNASQNNQERENNMQEDNTTNPMGDNAAGATPADPVNPVAGDSGQMSTADEQSAVSNQVDQAMGGAPAAPAADGGSFAPSTPPADPMPPADPAPAEGGAPSDGSMGDAPATPPTDPMPPADTQAPA